MHKGDEKETVETRAEEASQISATQAGATQAGADLDLEGLDLTVETVEERISPSETNVFDK